MRDSPLFKGSYFVRISIPWFFGMCGVCAAVSYFSAVKITGHRKSSAYIALITTLLWAASSVLAAWRQPRATISDEWPLAILAGTISLITLGLGYFGMRLRPTIALPISLICGSAWLLLAWLTKTAH
jgi:hypothetical protein